MAIKKIGSAIEVISLDDARTHLRIEPYGSPAEHPDDMYVSTLITVAREWCEEYLQRSIGTQTLEVALDKFPKSIELQPHTQSVTFIKFYDVDDVYQTLNPLDYRLDTYSTPNWVIPAFGKVFPVSNGQPNSVITQFVSGYTDGLSPNDTPCPAPIKAAMLLIIGNLYENRQQDVLGNTRISFNSLPLGVYNLLQPYRLGMGM